jgi:periplasmic protein TonB
MTFAQERLDRWLIASVFFHAALFTLAIFSPSLFPSFGSNWGSPTGGAGGINVKIVGSVSGVPLPTPEVVEEKAAANESPGFYKTEEAPPPPPPDKAELIPETKAPVKTTPPPKPPKPAASSKKTTAPAPPPSNAIPYGQGGRPALAYGQFSTGAGAAGIGFGDSTFGDRYGWYVDAITRAISQNWLKSLIDTRMAKAPRVYLSFDIARNGKVGNVAVAQSSGIPSLDRSAQRAVLASDPLPSLPPDYRGGSINVNFYFEYSR